MSGVATNVRPCDLVQLRVQARDAASGFTVLLSTRLQPSDLIRAYRELLEAKQEILEILETNPATPEQLAEVLEPLDRVIYRGAFVVVFVDRPDGADG